MLGARPKRTDGTTAETDRPLQQTCTYLLQTSHRKVGGVTPHRMIVSYTRNRRNRRRQSDLSDLARSPHCPRPPCAEHRTRFGELTTHLIFLSFLGVSSSPALRSRTVHRFQPRWGWLGMTGDDWGWLGEGGDGGDGSSVTEITYGKFIN